MNITRNDLQAAVQNGVLQPEQIDPLLTFLAHHHAGQKSIDTPRFSGTHILYYLGGLLAIGAATLFATLAVEAQGMPALLALALAYTLFAFSAAVWLEKPGLAVPTSILATLGIALTPLTVYASQHLLGFWVDSGTAQHYRDYHAWIDWRWLIMELATLLVGVVALMRFRYPFLLMPVAWTLWYLGMDVIPALMQSSNGGDWFSGAAWELRKTISVVFGLVVLLVAFFVDLRSRHSKDFAFWLYLSGLLTFSGGLSMMGSGALSGKLVFLALHFGMVFIGAVLARRTFAVFGGIGILMVLGDLSWSLFKDSFAFVAVLTLLGFALIALGIWWSKNETRISTKLRAVLPKDLSELLVARHTTR